MISFSSPQAYQLGSRGLFLFADAFHIFQKERQENPNKQAEGSRDLSGRISESSLTLEPFATSSVNALAEVTGGAEKGIFRFQGTFTGASGKYGDAVEHPLTIHSRYMPVNRTAIGSFTERTDISAALPGALKALKPEDLNEMRAKVLIDGRRISDPERFREEVTYAAVGLGPRMYPFKTGSNKSA